MTDNKGESLKQLERWTNILKAFILILAVLVFLPIVFFLYIYIGIIGGIVIYSAYLFIVSVHIRNWVEKKFGER